MRSNSNNSYKIISTKISLDSYRLLLSLCNKRGITIYQFVQLVVDTLIRYMDEDHNLSPDLEESLTIFDHLQGWKDSATISAPFDEPEFTEAIYFIGSKGKKGRRALYVTSPFMGERESTYNVQKILERFLCLLMPERYKRLRAIAVEGGNGSILSCFDQMIAERESEEDLRAIRSGFEDVRDFMGQSVDYTPYKKLKQRGADNIADRQRILGEDYGSGVKDHESYFESFQDSEEESFQDPEEESIQDPEEESYNEEVDYQQDDYENEDY